MSNAVATDSVLVGVDGSAASAAAVRWAAAEAAGRHTRLHAVHVVEHEDGDDPRLELDLARRTVPGRVGDWVCAEGIEVDIAVSIVAGRVATQLTEAASQAALVVIGAPVSPRHHALPAELAARCLCPVTIVGEQGDTSSLAASAVSVRTEGARHARP
jgi:nucleotide-binding universal stress UspA family protein